MRSVIFLSVMYYCGHAYAGVILDSNLVPPLAVFFVSFCAADIVEFFKNI